MKLVFLWFGKTDNPALVQLIDDYIGRIGHYLPCEVITIKEPGGHGNLPAEKKKSSEADMFRKHFGAKDIIVLLDENGDQFSSKSLASWLGKKMASGKQRIIFAIGGTDGFDAELLKKADFRLSLSSLTFTHQMARLILSEQIYRSLTILKGESYHR
jgi:23S rRNA (pseudouridine1915-N3)-methyltransferase